jgi:DNA-binding CsgD family transcriptional regulator
MPDLRLTERDQHLLRRLIDSDPVPGSPIPEPHVLEMIAEFVRCDSLVVVLCENGGPVLAEADVPPQPVPDGGGHDTLYVGTMHWGRRPLEAERCGALIGMADGVAVGFRNGPNAVAQIGLGREKVRFSDRDLAAIDLLYPVFKSHLRTRPTPSLPASLTVAERRVLNHVSTGLSNDEVAERLFIAPSTVGKHLENIYRKLGVTNRMAAVVALRGSTLIDPERAHLVETAG